MAGNITTKNSKDTKFDYLYDKNYSLTSVVFEDETELVFNYDNLFNRVLLNMCICAPCRDGADNDAVYGDTDYYGQSRILNGYADMGAVEYSGVQDCEDCDFNRSAAVDFVDFDN